MSYPAQSRTMEIALGAPGSAPPLYGYGAASGHAAGNGYGAYGRLGSASSGHPPYPPQQPVTPQRHQPSQSMGRDYLRSLSVNMASLSVSEGGSDKPLPPLPAASSSVPSSQPSVPSVSVPHVPTHTPTHAHAPLQTHTPTHTPHSHTYTHASQPLPTVSWNPSPDRNPYRYDLAAPDSPYLLGLAPPIPPPPREGGPPPQPALRPVQPPPPAIPLASRPNGGPTLQTTLQVQPAKQSPRQGKPPVPSQPSQSRPSPAAQSRPSPAAQSRPSLVAQSRPSPVAQNRPSPARQSRPSSAPTTPTASPAKQKPKQQSKQSTPQRSRRPQVIDLTADSDEYTPSDESDPPLRTPRRRIAASATPPRSPAPSCSPGPAAQCAGFTRAGAPCKRLVRAAAPLLAHSDTASERYCKDHAGLVCAPAGFYWRDGRGKAGVWIQFKDYIPADLGQQTQTLLRMTMERALSDKESPGFLYAYELRSLGTTTTSYFKVGRTDNVPRRLGQWSNRKLLAVPRLMAECTSHAPTLRDIFPLRPGGLARAPSARGSLLPGAVRAGVDASRMVPAVKRWERLVHLELADRAAASRGHEYDALAKPCADCGSIHREIFPIADGNGRAYETVVVEAIARWEAFIRTICA